MYRSLLFTFAITFCVSPCMIAAQELPVSSSRALETLEREIAAARQKAIKALEADLQRVMKSGNLDTANAINDEIESQKRLLPIPAAGVNQAMARMAGKRDIAGRPNDHWVFHADGSLESPQAFAGGTGTWSYDAQAKKIHITCPRWSTTLDWVSNEVWLENGHRKWTLQK